MNKLIFLTIFIFSSITLQAYSKNIVMAAMSTQKSALKMIKGLPQKSSSIYILSKKYNFDFRIKKLGKHYLVLAGVFHNRKEAVIVLKKIRKGYPGAYPVVASKIKKEVVEKKAKPTLVKAVDKKITKVINKKAKLKNKKQDIKVKIKVKEKVKIKKETKIKVEEKVKIKSKIEKKDVIKKKPKIQVVESESLFHWSYIVLVILFGIFIFYFIKYKRIYDEY